LKRQVFPAPSVAVPLITEWKVPEDVPENSAVPSPWITVPAGSCEQVAALRSKLTGTEIGLSPSAEPANAGATIVPAARRITPCLNNSCPFPPPAGGALPLWHEYLRSRRSNQPCDWPGVSGSQNAARPCIRRARFGCISCCGIASLWKERRV